MIKYKNVPPSGGVRGLRCLIVEDEPIAQEIIENFIGRLPFLELAGKASNAFEAYDFLAQQAIDLIFCDIAMPQISGLEFLKSLTNRPLVIMTTAYHQHAHEGFELDVTDYLLKPIAFERFLRAIQKVKEKIELKDTRLQKQVPAENTINPPQHQITTTPTENHIFVKEDGNLVKVLFEDIEYVEGMKDYVKIYVGKRFIVTYLTMKKMEESLPAGLFVRNHKSYIVNLSKINGISGNMLALTTNVQIPIGMQHREVLLARLGTQIVVR